MKDLSPDEQGPRAVVAVLLGPTRLRPSVGSEVHPARAVGYLAAASFTVVAPVVALVELWFLLPPP